MTKSVLSYAIDDPSHLAGSSNSRLRYDRFEVAGEWFEVEDAAARLRLFAGDGLPTIHQGICPSCSELLTTA